MTDQQRCPDLVVPDSVIEQAACEAAVAARRLENRVLGDPYTAAISAAAPVIARWAREQGRTEGAAEERARIRERFQAFSDEIVPVSDEAAEEGRAMIRALEFIGALNIREEQE